MSRRSFVWAALLAAAVLVPGPVDAQGVREILSRAVSDFDRGRLEASAAGFDRVAELAPDVAPQLWQRGIALYYVGRYRDCREQFESHRTVNPNDVENAAWHFLCVAREESPASALAALLPVGPDPRAPMTEIYRMFRGEVTPEAVLAAGEQGGRARPLLRASVRRSLPRGVRPRRPCAHAHHRSRRRTVRGRRRLHADGGARAPDRARPRPLSRAHGAPPRRLEPRRRFRARSRPGRIGRR